ncbi:MAG: DUF362 domain-containing protein [Syntrophothermus sp.]
MPSQINRRTFIKAGAVIGAGTLFGNYIINDVFASASGLIQADRVDLSVIQGSDYYSCTVKAVEALGGMKRFVKQNSRVGLLVNSRYKRPGTYVKPEITMAVVNMCIDAGAKDIISLESITSSYWRLNRMSEKYSATTGRIKQAGNNYKKVSIPKGVSLKEAEVEKSLLDCDVFINVPIFKQHEGIRVTGCLKNLMGLTSQDTNEYFHNGSNSGGGYNDIVFLSQCIADINLIRKPDLCIGDATEYITTNGPFGPGNIEKSQKIIAGTDTVAVDSWGAKLLGYNPEDILMIRMAAKHGIGNMDLSKMKIREVNV